MVQWCGSYGIVKLPECPEPLSTVNALGEVVLDLELSHQIEFAIRVRMQQILNISTVQLTPPPHTASTVAEAVCEHAIIETSQSQRECR